VVNVWTPDAGNAPAADPAATAIAFARAQIGKPYGWGATGPDKYDCSGLVQAAYAAAGISLPRTTFLQITKGTAVAKADLAPGDLVFPDVGHVQIYTGNGNIVESPKMGDVVRERPMWGFSAARRIVPPTGATSGTTASTSSSASTASSSSTSGSDINFDLTNPGTWGNGLMAIAIKTSIIVAGLGLVLLGAARLVAPSGSSPANMIGALT
jgi:uncharacterized protein YycO